MTARARSLRSFSSLGVLASLALSIAPSAGCKGCGRGGEPSSGPSPSASAALTPSSSAPAAASSSAPAADEAVRLSPPWGAGRVGGQVVAAGVVRGSPQSIAAVALGPSGEPAARAVKARERLEAADDSIRKPSSLDVVASASGLLVLVDEGASGTRALRAESVAALASSGWEPFEPVACAAGPTLFAMGRKESERAATARGFGAGEARPAGSAPGQPPATLVCTSEGAFVITEEGSKRVARALGENAKAQATLTGDGQPRDDERGVQVVPDGSGLLLVRLGDKTGLALRAWDGKSDRPGAWAVGGATPGDGAQIELVVPRGDEVAVVVSRPVSPSRPCKSDDETDAVAELWVLEKQSGKPKRSGERLERWSCGAEPGPFFGGLVGEGEAAQIAVAWPRGADASCARQGVRYGGLAWAVARASGPLQTGRVDAPAEDIDDAGCEGVRCQVVVLGRGEPGACTASGDPLSGRPRLVSFP